MPNWCTGDLKVRGAKKQIVNFLENEFFILGGVALNRKYEKPTVEMDGYVISVDVGERGMWINGARMYFEDDIYADIQTKDEELNDNSLITTDLGELQAAWGIDTKLLTSLSKKYNLDIKIYAYERGMEFNLDYEVHSGEIIRNEEITFKDYVWECPQPRIGG